MFEGISDIGPEPDSPLSPAVLSRSLSKTLSKSTSKLLERDPGSALDEHRLSRKVAPLLLQVLGLQQMSFEGWRKFVATSRAPLQFSIWPQFQDMSSSAGTFSVNFGRLGRLESAEVSSDPSEENLPSRYNGRCAPFLIEPGSNLRIFWDLLCTMFLIYDILMIPALAFDPERDTFMVTMEWLTLVFWSSDMIMSCITGVVVKGVTHMEAWFILKVYLRTWFILDIIVVVPDWIFTIMELTDGEESGGAADSGKLLRALRFFRTIRLLRLAKLQRIIMLLRDRIESESTFIVVMIAKYLSMLLMLSHLLAALFWVIGTLSKNGGDPNWIETQDFGEKQVFYKYLTSLHWALCMFTPGSMSVQPQNVPERLMAITILVCGLVVFTAFISSVTASIAQLRALQGDKGKTLWMLRRFLRQHGISQGLSFRVLRYAENALYAAKDRKLAMHQVSAFNHLTDQLRTEVTFEAVYSCLSVHPVFEQMVRTTNVTMFRLVGTALSQRPLAKDDVLFTYGQQASHMHLVVSGEVGYIKRINDAESAAVTDDWLCEPILWVPWGHVGAAHALMSSELVSVTSATFIEVMKLDVPTMSFLVSYAQKFAEHLSIIPKSELSDVSKHSEARQLALDILDCITVQQAQYKIETKERLLSKVHPDAITE